MKNYLRTLLQKNNLSIFIIVVLAIFVRFYNFEDRVTFWSEQARSLIVSAEYLSNPSLLGQEYFREDKYGHKIFSGALFNYSLVPLYLVFYKNPIYITAYFSVLNIFTGLLLYKFIKKNFDRNLAILTSILFLFNDLMIYHSLFIWNYNYLPLVGLVGTYVAYKNWHKSKIAYSFFLGLVSGIGISLQILFMPFAAVLLTTLLWKNKTRFRVLLYFIFGIILGNLPMVLFDLRHSFYHSKTIWNYFIEVFQGNRGDIGFAYYYFLPLWPLAAIVLAFLVLKYFGKNRILIAIFVFAYVLLNLNSNKIDFQRPTGMPPGLKVKDIKTAGEIIAFDSKGDFNVASTLDFDKRAYILRYFVKYNHGKDIESEEEYKNLDFLYVLAQKDFDFQNSNIWEIKTGWPYNASELIRLNDYAIYKLEK